MASSKICVSNEGNFHVAYHVLSLPLRIQTWLYFVVNDSNSDETSKSRPKLSYRSLYSVRSVYHGYVSVIRLG